MIGKQYFEIGANDWLSGVTSGANTLDGGLSNVTQQMNITAVPGALYPPGAVVDASTNLSDEIIASCEDPEYLGENRMLLDDSGNFYSYDGTILTKEDTASAAAMFTQGTTDMVPWFDSANISAPNFYATTSAGDTYREVVKWNGTSTLTEDWWTSTLGQPALSSFTSWRPLLVYNNDLYVGDAEKLHRIDEDGLTVSNGILNFTASNIISALGIDQGSGKMLIATNAGSNYSGQNDNESEIMLYDGFSDKVTRAVPVDGLVTAFKSVGNTTYVFYGNKLGVWTGSGISYLRTLNFDKGSSSTLIYPHRAMGIDNTLYWVDTLPGGVNKQIMAYGETINNIRGFYPILYPTAAAGSLTAIFPVSSTEIGYSFATSKMYTFDTTDIAAVTNGGAQAHSKRYRFPRDVTFNGVIAEWDQAAPTGDKNLFSLTVIDSKGNTTQSPQFNPGTRSDIYEWEFTNPTIETRSIQIKINWGGNGSDILGLRRLTVFYTPKE